MTNRAPISQRLGLANDFEPLVEALVDWCAPDPQPVFDLVWSAGYCQVDATLVD